MVLNGSLLKTYSTVYIFFKRSFWTNKPKANLGGFSVCPKITNFLKLSIHLWTVTYLMVISCIVSTATYIFRVQQNVAATSHDLCKYVSLSPTFGHRNTGWLRTVVTMMKVWDMSEKIKEATQNWFSVSQTGHVQSQQVKHLRHLISQHRFLIFCACVCNLFDLQVGKVIKEGNSS